MPACDTTKLLSHLHHIKGKCPCGAAHIVVGYVSQLAERSPVVPCICGQLFDMTPQFEEFATMIDRMKKKAAAN